MDAVDRVVREYVAQNVLTEGVVTNALKILRRQLIDRTRSTNEVLPALESEKKRLSIEIDNLVSALACAESKPDPVVRAIAERQEKLSAVEARIDAVKTTPHSVMSKLQQLERQARANLAEFQKSLADHPGAAREFLSKIFDGPLRFTAQGDRYRIEGQVSAPAALFYDVPNSASPGGFEPPLAT